MLTKELQITLNIAVNEAHTRRHEFLTLEHLLLALLHEQAASNVIRQCGGDIEELKRELEAFLTANIEQLPEGEEQTPEQTAAFQRVLQRAVMQAQASGQMEINGGNILAALYHERHSQAVYLLEKQGITRLDVLNYISHGISKIADSSDPFSIETGAEDEEDERSARDPLAAFTTNLVERAKEGRIDPL